ncbi:hypothetical protein LCGC14_2500950, partial [marine sediment metagenome]
MKVLLDIKITLKSFIESTMNRKNYDLFANAAEKGKAYTFSDITLRDIPSN